MEAPTLITFLVESDEAKELAERYKHTPMTIVELDARQIKDLDYMAGIGYYIGHSYLTFFIKYFMAAKTYGNKKMRNKEMMI